VEVQYKQTSSGPLSACIPTFKMSKAMTDVNMIAPAPLNAHNQQEEKAVDEPTTAIHELPNDFDDSENIHVNWFRGTVMQTLIVGLASFLAPGAYAALAATGAGGLANVRQNSTFP
jgi:hypothetical protein